MLPTQMTSNRILWHSCNTDIQGPNCASAADDAPECSKMCTNQIWAARVGTHPDGMCVSGAQRLSPIQVTRSLLTVVRLSLLERG